MAGKMEACIFTSCRVALGALVHQMSKAVGEENECHKRAAESIRLKAGGFVHAVNFSCPTFKW